MLIEEEMNKESFIKIWYYLKKYKTAIFLSIPLLLCIYIRVMPLGLPIVNGWANNNVDAMIHQQITGEVLAQHPKLPDKALQQEVNKKFIEFYEQNEDAIKNEKLILAQQFRNYYQDEDGITYLMAIDPWLWYGHARNYIRHGHPGDTYIDLEYKGQIIDLPWWSLRNGRQGTTVGWFKIFPLTIVINYKILNIIKTTTLMEAAFLTPAILMCLAVILAYFIGKKVGDNDEGEGGEICGLVFAFVIATNNALLFRTMGGFADTDSFITLSVMMVLFCFTYTFKAEDKKGFWMWIALCGVSLGIYSLGHRSYYHIFDILIASTGIYFLWNWYKKKYGECWHAFKVCTGFVGFGWFFITLVSVILKHKTVLDAFIITVRISLTDFLLFINLKAPTAGGGLFPNVMGTVAELGASDVGTVFLMLGGTISVMVGIFGMMLLFSKWNERNFLYALFLTIWFLAGVYAAQASLRFVAFALPPFALGLGYFVSEGSKYVVRQAKQNFNIHPWIVGWIIFMLFIILFGIPSFTEANSTAVGHVPMVNDMWVDALGMIKDGSSEETIITSWWDFGHIFNALSERHVTFDGGDQGERIHWVGKILTTDNETEALGLLRMLNCGQQDGFHKLESFLNNDTIRAVEVLDEIILLSMRSARTRLTSFGLSSEQSEEVLSLTHCEDVWPNYFIVSSDMVSKAPVWSHFGLWNFTRAQMFLDGEMPYGVDVNNWLAPWLNTNQIPNSIFVKLFFEDGERLECFDEFYDSGRTMDGMIVKIYKINWDCHDKLLS